MQSPDSLRKQTWFWLGVLAVIGITLIARWALQEERRSFVALQQTYERITCADELLSSSTDDEVTAFGYLAGGRGYLRPEYGSEKVLHEHENVSRLCSFARNDPKQRDHFERLGLLIQDQAKSLSEAVRARDSAGFDPIRAGILAEHGKRVMDEIRQVVGEISNEERATLPGLLQKRLSRLRAGYAAIFVSASLALGCLLIAQTNLRKTISRRKAFLAQPVARPMGVVPE